MSALLKIIPETMPAMASVPFEIAQAMDGPRFYVAGNRLLKNLKSIRESAALFRKNFKTLPKVMEGLSDSDIDAWTEQMLSMEGRMVELRAQARHAIASVENKNKGKTRRTLLRRVSSATDQMYLEFLRVMRDARWEVMTLRAWKEPAGDGPVISSTEEMKDFFDKLPAFNAA